MKVNKKTYLQPNTTVLYVETEGMICSSVQPNPNSAIQTDNTYTPGGEHNGGSEEWQDRFDKRNYKEGGALNFYIYVNAPLFYNFFVQELPQSSFGR